MEFSCPCLNVQLHVPAFASQFSASPAPILCELSGVGDVEALSGLCPDSFFAAALATDSFRQAHRVLLQWSRTAGSWAEGRQFPSLVGQRVVTSGEVEWEVVRCLLCEADLWAKPVRVGDSVALLVNADIPSGAEVRAMGDSPDFSAALGVRILHTPGGGGDSLGVGEEWWSGGSGAAAQVQASVSEYLRSEQEAMESRVRAYVEAEHNRFELLRKEAKRQRDSVLRDLQARDLVKDSSDSPTLAALRARNGSGGEDSAVPLSPISLASLSDSGTTSQPLGIRNSNRSGLNASPVIGSEDSGHGKDDKNEDEELFHLDEEHLVMPTPPPTEPSSTPSLGGPPPPCLADDEAETDDSGTGEDLRRFASDVKSARGLLGAQPIATQGAGCLVSACGKSLPVRVPCRFWPPKDAIGSEQASSSEDEDEYTGDRIAVKPRRGADYSGKDVREGRRREVEMAESMRKLARSIQTSAWALKAADDPERIFGERPVRRRYKTGTQAIEAVVRMRHSGRPQQHSFQAPI